MSASSAPGKLVVRSLEVDGVNLDVEWYLEITMDLLVPQDVIGIVKSL